MDMTYFNAKKTRDNLVQWIRNWFDKNGPDSKAVIGILSERREKQEGSGIMTLERKLLEEKC